jgi:transposase-like protein
MFEPGTEAQGGISGGDFSAVRALAAHLDVTPQQLGDWLRESRGVPPQVLLSWICLWDLKRR